MACLTGERAALRELRVVSAGKDDQPLELVRFRGTRIRGGEPDPAPQVSSPSGRKLADPQRNTVRIGALVEPQ
jgi:hypothetical protein